MAKVIGVKFKNTAKVYYFAPAEGETDYKEKSGVVVETAKGLEYGTVVFGLKEVDDKEIVHPLKPIVRKATEKDQKTVRENEKKIPEAMEFAEQKIAEMGLVMKLIGCEFSFDGKKIVFFFTADGRVDFRELVKVLAARFHLRIELRQVGIRDETKILGGIAPCGRTCCCASCMSEFGKVSIKMAKNQGLHSLCLFSYVLCVGSGRGVRDNSVQHVTKAGNCYVWVWVRVVFPELFVSLDIIIPTTQGSLLRTFLFLIIKIFFVFTFVNHVQAHLHLVS